MSRAGKIGWLLVGCLLFWQLITGVLQAMNEDNCPDTCDHSWTTP